MLFLQIPCFQYKYLLLSPHQIVLSRRWSMCVSLQRCLEEETWWSHFRTLWYSTVLSESPASDSTPGQCLSQWCRPSSLSSPPATPVSRYSPGTCPMMWTLQSPVRSSVTTATTPADSASSSTLSSTVSKSSCQHKLVNSEMPSSVWNTLFRKVQTRLVWRSIVQNIQQRRRPRVCQYQYQC